MSSQDVVNFIRQKAYEGMELTEIGEFMCDMILSPEAATGGGVDNMTIVIVAILNGRTKEEWYTWIHDRVANNYGYPTPSEPPQIYSQHDVRAGRERKIERRNKKYDYEPLGCIIGDDGSDLGLMLNALSQVLDRGTGSVATAGGTDEDGSVHITVLDPEGRDF
jgi:protein phosphatase PTC2/3